MKALTVVFFFTQQFKTVIFQELEPYFSANTKCIGFMSGDLRGLNPSVRCTYKSLSSALIPFILSFHDTFSAAIYSLITD